MIVSASYRTDIPAHHGRWFAERLRAGYCDVANPYGGPRRRVSLDPANAEAFVFWTRNPAPFLPVLANLAERGRPFVVQVTLTGYPRPLEAATPEAESALAAIGALANRFGPDAVVWRYDPVVLSSITPEAWHRDTFARLARALEGHVNEVVISFVQAYAKTRRNMDKAAARFGFSWHDPEADEKRALAGAFRDAAAERGMTLAVCGQKAFATDGIGEARCIDPERLTRVAGRPIAASGRSHRKVCACAPAADIGAYDTCAQGCAYCYAVSSRARAKDNLARHDPCAPGLDGASAAPGRPATAG